ncbi:hypothetical protein CEQ23_00465 (plasmid) [Burkholderia cepacia]|uniref:Lipoprotein n=1 Tax=Burkholderia cepacia TaxID=292 RepID=A0ABN5CW77_BURCE|nr:hypothetical protein DM41_7682 [Burkholderia cepacia ATCC 25416]ASE92184.1 hypothetical protein CEQ23_00465 [Burkholderia cepacia]PNO64913.1 hypothetical protein DK10_034395 [Burkholderia cenocepacia]ALK23669.1 hypothetical protein APZ15_37740 [Burkholderia cepacia ATCC 25416]ATF79493.1 hypothetical protein CO711_18580 [Burkholderia cepacia]
MAIRCLVQLLTLGCMRKQDREPYRYGTIVGSSSGLAQRVTATDGAAEELTPVFAAAASDNFYSQTEII